MPKEVKTLKELSEIVFKTGETIIRRNWDMVILRNGDVIIYKLR